MLGSKATCLGGCLLLEDVAEPEAVLVTGMTAEVGVAGV